MKHAEIAVQNYNSAIITARLKVKDAVLTEPSTAAESPPSAALEKRERDFLGSTSHRSAPINGIGWLDQRRNPSAPERVLEHCPRRGEHLCGPRRPPLREAEDHQSSEMCVRRMHVPVACVEAAEQRPLHQGQVCEVAKQNFGLASRHTSPSKANTNGRSHSAKPCFPRPCLETSSVVHDPQSRGFSTLGHRLVHRRSCRRRVKTFLRSLLLQGLYPEVVHVDIVGCDSLASWLKDRRSPSVGEQHRL